MKMLTAESPLAEGRELKFIPKEEWLDVGLSPLAEGRELKFSALPM